MNSGKEFENYVKSIYSILLNLKDEGVIVSSQAIVKGTNGENYKIDVYYEFERAGVRHRVIIECKDWKDPVKREQIHVLESKVRHIPGVIGVIISKVGYQSGAIEFAKKNGILTLTIDELPSLVNVIVNRLKTVLLPNENCIGEPFWGIMETVDGQITTPTWFALRFDSNDEMLSTPLFFSKHHAELFFKQRCMSKNKWAVIGLPRYVLRAFIIQLEGFEIRQKLFDEIGKGAVLMFLPPNARQSDYFSPIPITRKQLMYQYYGEEIPSVNS